MFLSTVGKTVRADPAAFPGSVSVAIGAVLSSALTEVIYPEVSESF